MNQPAAKRASIRWTDSSIPLILPTLEGRGDTVDVHVVPAAQAIVSSHLSTAPVELGGLLIGRAWRAAPGGAITHVAILKAVPARLSDGTSISLRMGTAVWDDARLAMGTDELIVGWYHSHPGLTAFFSDTDRQTQRAFFMHDYSVGWVIDPLLDDEAFFIGPDCRPIRRGPDSRPASPPRIG